MKRRKPKKKPPRTRNRTGASSPRSPSARSTPMPLPPSEARLRDYLVGHLDLIEPGLTLVDTEFEVPNILGARGFIDILAWDNVRNLVIIELKVSVVT